MFLDVKIKLMCRFASFQKATVGSKESKIEN